MKRTGKPQAARWNLAGFSDSAPIVGVEDQESRAEVYRRRLHHLPGVGICPDHATFLARATALRFCQIRPRRNVCGLEQETGQEMTVERAILGRRRNVGDGIGARQIVPRV
jgi:hypothetical protein